MIVYRTKNDLAGHLDTFRQSGRSIGLVATMGALHPGHASLVERSAAENDITVVSIFVNPTQFNDPADLNNYPRTLDDDLALLQSLYTDLVFVPSVEEMYPGEDSRSFDFGNLDSVMEGRYRKGHFNGVAQIVSKLLELVSPDRAYFGQKDFQQLVIIQRLVELLGLDVEIVPCPIMRDKDGLALSSRNSRLTKEERKLAPFIYRTLHEAREKRGSMTPEEVKTWVDEQFAAQPGMRLEYFDIVDDRELTSVSEWSDPGTKVGCLAVYIGDVRLIDNLFFD